MNKMLVTLFFAACLVSVSSISAWCGTDEPNFAKEMTILNDRTSEIPVIRLLPDRSDEKWEYIPDVAQYRCGDWSTCIGLAHNVTREVAKAYAESNPDISFFFYVKGYLVILENDEAPEPFTRVFQHGDAVFFGGEAKKSAHWGKAFELADGYVKKQS